MATAFLVLYVGDFTWLLLLRCVQGLGAAMVSGTTVAILASLFPREMGLVIGINTTAVYVGTTLGPVLGGFLVNYAGWPSLFIFSGTLALVSAMLALLSLDFTKRVGRVVDSIPSSSSCRNIHGCYINARKEGINMYILILNSQSHNLLCSI
jgi:MFS family permease